MRIRQFGARLFKHGLGEIGAPQVAAPPREAQGQVGRTGADVEHSHARAWVRLANNGIQQFVIAIEREDPFGAGGLVVSVGPAVEIGGRKGVGHGKIVLEKWLALRRLPLYTENNHRSPTLSEGQPCRGKCFHQLQPRLTRTRKSSSGTF